MQRAGDLFFAAFGPHWRKVAAGRLGCSRRSIQRYLAGEVRLSPAVQRRLAAVAARPEAIEAWALGEHERTDAERAEWMAAASNLPTQLKLLAIEEHRNPPRNGRPRRRVSGPAPLIPARIPAPSALDDIPEYTLPRAPMGKR